MIGHKVNTVELYYNPNMDIKLFSLNLSYFAYSFDIHIYNLYISEMRTSFCDLNMCYVLIDLFFIKTMLDMTCHVSASNET